MYRATFILNWDPKKKIRGMPGAIKRALLVALKYWHQVFRPRHFQAGAVARYGYPARSRFYETRKQRRVGHSLPLTYSGRLKERTSRATFKATPRRGKVIMNMSDLVTKDGKNYATMRRKNRKPSLAKQVTTVTREESKTLAGVVQGQVVPWVRKKTAKKGLGAYLPTSYLGRMGTALTGRGRLAAG